MRNVWCGFALSLLMAAACGAQTWETSWEQFAKKIAPYPARSENAFDPEVKAKFDGKTAWEGTVSKNAKYSEETMFVMEMNQRLHPTVPRPIESTAGEPQALDRPNGSLPDSEAVVECRLRMNHDKAS
jgi:hypothetical protein